MSISLNPYRKSREQSIKESYVATAIYTGIAKLLQQAEVFHSLTRYFTEDNVRYFFAPIKTDREANGLVWQKEDHGSLYCGIEYTGDNMLAADNMFAAFQVFMINPAAFSGYLQTGDNCIILSVLSSASYSLSPVDTEVLNSLELQERRFSVPTSIDFFSEEKAVETINDRINRI